MSNITCTRCRYRHPVDITCEEARHQAEAYREKLLAWQRADEAEIEALRQGCNPGQLTYTPSSEGSVNSATDFIISMHALLERFCVKLCDCGVSPVVEPDAHAANCQYRECIEKP